MNLFYVTLQIISDIMPTIRNNQVFSNVPGLIPSLAKALSMAKTSMLSDYCELNEISSNITSGICDSKRELASVINDLGGRISSSVNIGNSCSVNGSCMCADIGGNSGRNTSSGRNDVNSNSSNESGHGISPPGCYCNSTNSVVNDLTNQNNQIMERGEVTSSDGDVFTPLNVSETLNDIINLNLNDSKKGTMTISLKDLLIINVKERLTEIFSCESNLNSYLGSIDDIKKAKIFDELDNLLCA